MEGLIKSRCPWLIAGIAGVAAMASQPGGAAPLINPAYVVNGAGAIPCSDYVLDRETTAPNMLAASVWFYGLITGINALSPDGAQIHVKTMVPLLADTDLYCTKHLKEPFSNAALNVIATILAHAGHPLPSPPAVPPYDRNSETHQ
jgi:hypothetical protein